MSEDLQYLYKQFDHNVIPFFLICRHFSLVFLFKVLLFLLRGRERAVSRAGTTFDEELTSQTM